jgi:hypothetical protein
LHDEQHENAEGCVCALRRIPTSCPLTPCCWCGHAQVISEENADLEEEILEDRLFEELTKDFDG